MGQLRPMRDEIPQGRKTAGRGAREPWRRLAVQSRTAGRGRERKSLLLPKPPPPKSFPSAARGAPETYPPASPKSCYRTGHGFDLSRLWLGLQVEQCGAGELQGLPDPYALLWPQEETS
ncbi:unnamed protein product [Rangifer tarandus platyrhynchus]|uniref:Uncharacterized protein n=1 Tax=Rangifer tarandus platyrhynchus TaxID=3082113 RepID=A0AC59YRX5_RANTA